MTQNVENNVSENIRSPRGVNMTMMYRTARVDETAIVDFSVDVELPHDISLKLLLPPFNIGFAALRRAGIAGITKGIMVATQKNVKPRTVPIFTSIAHEDQIGNTREKYPTTPSAAIRFPTVREMKLVTTKALHEEYFLLNHPRR